MDDLINSYSAPEYWYNSNGALSYDANKGVSWIDYDQLGNPIRVQFTDHSITEHVYTADGRRLKTIHRTSVPQSNPLGIGVTASLTPAQTQSIDSIDYVGSFIYEKGQLKRYMFDDGYLKLYTNTFSPRFFIKDHLGNNRIVTDGSGNIQQNTNYYPYGGMTSISTGQGEQQFKYNGKEYDPMHGLNEYDYGARQYDPAIGKFTTMDPLCEKYYHISPYAYCGGNPVNAVDVDGKDIWDIDECGNIVCIRQNTDMDKINIVRLQEDNSYKTMIDRYGNEKSVTFAYGTIKHSTGKTDKGVAYDIFKIKGDENGMETFKLLAMTCNVEFSLCQTGPKGSGDNYITTSRDENGSHDGGHHEVGMGHLLGTKFKNQSFRLHMHNHPDESCAPSDKDLHMAETYKNYCDNFRLFLKVYGMGPLEIPYNSTTKDSDLKVYKRKFNEIRDAQ